MTNVRVTILHDVWEEGPPEPVAEPVKAPPERWTINRDNVIA